MPDVELGARGLDQTEEAAGQLADSFGLAKIDSGSRDELAADAQGGCAGEDKARGCLLVDPACGQSGRIRSIKALV